MSKYLQALKKLSKLINNSSSREDLLVAFESMRGLVEKIELGSVEKEHSLEGILEFFNTELNKKEMSLKGLKKEFTELIMDEIEKHMKEMMRKHEDMMGEMMAMIEKESDETESEMQTKFNRLFSDFRKEHETKMLKHEQKIAKLKDGKDADEEKIVKEVLAKIPPVKFPEQKEVTAIEIRDKLELLKEDERLDKSAVKGLESAIEELRGLIAAVPKGGMRGMRKIPIIKKYRLTNQVDGSTRAFTLPNDTVNILALAGTQFPITFDENDWTFSGNTLTLANGIPTPQSGQTLMAIIETLFYG